MKNKILEQFFRKKGCFTTKDAEAAGISRQTLGNYCRTGKLMRMSRGIYLPVSENELEEPELEILQRKGTDFVLSLLSALKFYHIGTQNSPSTWITIIKNHHAPRVDFSMVCLRSGEEHYHQLVNHRVVNGLPIKVYSPAKTVADCFKYRHRVGLDVAIEALRDGWHKKLFTADELYQAAKVCRVDKVMMPYMEMLLG